MSWYFPVSWSIFSVCEHKDPAAEVSYLSDLVWDPVENNSHMWVWYLAQTWMFRVCSAGQTELDHCDRVTEADCGADSALSTRSDLGSHPCRFSPPELVQWWRMLVLATSVHPEASMCSHQLFTVRSNLQHSVSSAAAGRHRHSAASPRISEAGQKGQNRSAESPFCSGLTFPPVDAKRSSCCAQLSNTSSDVWPEVKKCCAINQKVHWTAQLEQHTSGLMHWCTAAIIPRVSFKPWFHLRLEKCTNWSWCLHRFSVEYLTWYNVHRSEVALSSREKSCSAVYVFDCRRVWNMTSELHWTCSEMEHLQDSSTSFKSSGSVYKMELTSTLFTSFQFIFLGQILWHSAKACVWRSFWT